jgi:hypothetical protein
MQIRFFRFASPFAITLVTAVAGVAIAPAAHAQVGDAERAGARELFKQGDTLQRAGKFAEALDKFQRAQQVFPAPTNVLRVAECDAALGHLVESTEAYREVLRTPLPANAPPAFQAAVDQAKAELSQVEPRVPKVVVQVQPAGVQGPQMQIDGQNVPGALIGEPMLLDAGSHKIVIIAPGFASAEQQIDLKEHETRTVNVALTAASGITYEAAAAPPPVAYQAPGQLAEGTPPPPPPPMMGPEAGETPQPRRSNLGLIFGLHLGVEGAAGTVPSSIDGASVNASTVSSEGVAFGFDAGFRFGRHWIVGLAFEHAGLNAGDLKDLSSDATTASSNTTSFGANIAFVGNPDRVSFYGELGVGERWYNVTEVYSSGDTTTTSKRLFSSAEFNMGLGVWIAIGRSVRLLPKVTLSLASLSDHDLASDGTPIDSTTFVAVGMLGIAGFYNLDL